MKLSKLLKAVGMTAIIGACLLPTACEVNVTKQGDTTINNLPEEYKGGNYTQNDDGTVVSNDSNIDFTNYVTFKNETDFSIRVRNNTSKKLVAFHTTPRPEQLISGIPAGAQNFGLKKVGTLFSSSNDFILFLITEEDYLANKNDLSALDNAPFTRLYAYYNANSSDNNVVYEISKTMGGNCSIVLNNGNSPYNVELRMNGIYGETIGYSKDHTVNTTFKVEAGDYYVFPVFRKFDTHLNEIVTVYPKNNKGGPIVEVFPLNEEQTSKTLNSNSWFQGVEFLPSASYVTIKNNSSQAISFFKGSDPMQTSTGSKLIAADGGEKTFAISMGLLSGDMKNNPIFQASSNEIGYSIGNAMSDKYYIINGSTTRPSEGFDFYAGKRYYVKVTGGENMEFTVDTSWKDTSEDVTF